MFLLLELWQAALTAGGVAALLLALLRWRASDACERRAASAALALAFIAGFSVQEGRLHFSPAERVDWLPVLAAAGALLGLAAPRAQAWSAPALALAGGAVTGCLALSGSLRLAELAGLASVLGAVAWLATAAAPVLPALLLAALIYLGHTLAELPLSCVLLLALALGGSLLALPPRWSARRTAGVRLALALLPGAAAVALALRASPALEY